MESPVDELKALEKSEPLARQMLVNYLVMIV